MSFAIIEGEHKNVIGDFVRVYELLDNAIQLSPNNGTYYIGTDGSEEMVTYVEQKRIALGILATLQSIGVKKGDYIMVDVSDNKIYHLLMWACFYGGFIITTLPRPDFYNENSQTVNGVLQILNMLKFPVIITDEVVCDIYKKITNSSKVYVPDELYSEQIGKIADIKTNDAAYIQFSSGSTGNRKGAILTNENLICASCNIVDFENCVYNERPLMWLPHTHNFGAFTFTLLAAILGCNSWSMSTELFVRNPALFMKKVSQHKITRLCTNNLGIQVLLGLAEKVPGNTFDLTALKAIYIGAEKPSYKLMIAFASAYGIDENIFKPGYGMSETVLTVCSSSGFSSSSILPVSRKSLIEDKKVEVNSDINDYQSIPVIEHGRPVTNTTIGIFNEENVLLEENMVGSIRIKSKTVFKGYCNSSDNTDVFCDGWYITGDLGFIRDGKVYIVGRTKDIIIINGVNYMLTDLESIAEQKLDSKYKLLFVSVASDLQESLVIFIEILDDSLEQFQKNALIIKDFLRCEYGIEAKEIIPVKKIRLNASRKVDRYGMKVAYLNGEFDSIIRKYKINVSEKSANTIMSDENKLISVIAECWSQVLEIEQIPLDKSYKSLGGNSVKGYFLIQQIEEKLKEIGYPDIKLSQDIFLKCSTIREMAEYISALKPTESDDKVISCEDEVAITGIAFRLPKVSTQEELWKVLVNGVECVEPTSAKRKLLSHDDSWNDVFGQIEDIDCFDYEFFNISEEEAKYMDPQQRLSLEVAYEALDDSGEGVLEDKNKNISVISASSGNSYITLLLDYIKNKGTDCLPETTMVNNLNSTIATRIAKYLNSSGVAMNIDSACSSFMTALLTAEKIVKNGDSEGAIVVGANVFPSSYIHSIARKAGILSSSNCTKVFAEDADGSLLGEGVIAVYIEGKSRAIKNRKHIYGVIAGGAMNNDGASLSIMAPNPLGQYDVLKKTYAQSGVDINKISYIEAHGTGTKIGDPIELTSLQHMFGKRNPDSNKIYIGSVKSNFGHTLPCAGGAGLLKVLMCLKNNKLVPVLNVKKVNPLLNNPDFPFEMLISPMDWLRVNNNDRYAGINSFGIGGTNAHVVIKDCPEMYMPDNNDEKSYNVVVCSAKREEDLSIIKQNITEVINNGVNINDLCFTLSKARNHYKYRCSFIIDNKRNICGETSYGKQTKIIGNKIAIIFNDDTLEEQTKELLNQRLKKLTDNRCFFTNVTDSFKADCVICINSSKELIDKVKEYINPNVIRNLMIKSKEVDRKYVMACLLREIYVCGANINWNELWQEEPGHIVSLPTYPFKKTKAWIE